MTLKKKKTYKKPYLLKPTLSTFNYQQEYFWTDIKVESLDKITEFDENKVKTTFYTFSKKLNRKILCVIWKRIHLNIGDELKVLGRFKNEKTVFAISKIIITKRNRNEVNNG